ncbi:hypothetical protein [Reyranella sp.]|uniref:hypothetical protein n=1 Tax=Reyranella sp. TaxID=1929291 RepID=UPI0037840FCE
MNWVRRKSAVICIVSLVLLAGLPLLPVLLGEGWPANHEENAFDVRTYIHAEHLRQGDWFPIWASADNDRFGSFQPLLYHKLFYALSGPLYVLIGHIKSAMLICLWLWMAVGATGTYVLCRGLRCGQGFAWCGGVMLIVANYTTTNWLVRGAMAEFSAAMLVPWVLAAFAQWLMLEENRYRASMALGLIAGLMFLAHSVLTYYLAILLGVATLLMVTTRQLSLRRLMPMPLLTGAASFAAIAGPGMLAMYLVGRDHDLKRMLSHPYTPEHQMHPAMRYIWDIDFKWGKLWTGYTMQLDAPVLVLLLGGLIAALTTRSASVAVRPGGNTLTGGQRVVVLALVIGLALSLLLQTTWAIPFYRYFPGAAYIQFPWRLLAFITPVMIALSLWLWHTVPSVLSVPVVAGTLAASVWLSGAWAPAVFLEKPVTLGLRDLHYGVLGEYVPLKAGAVFFYKESDVAKLLEQAGCRLEASPRMNGEPAEQMVQEYVLNCDRPGTYPLPLFGSPLHVVETGELDKRPIGQRCAEAPEAPGLCAVRLERAGRHQIRIRMPSLGSLLGL